MTMSARIGVMNAGYLEQVGTPVEIYEYPATTFVADFIGTANMFTGVVALDRADHVVVTCAELGRDLTVAHGDRVPVGAPVTVMVRPEKMLIRRDPPVEDDLNCVKGFIADIAYLGDVSIYHVELESGRKVQVSQINLRHTSEQPLTWYDPVHVAWHPANSLVLMQ